MNKHSIKHSINHTIHRNLAGLLCGILFLISTFFSYGKIDPGVFSGMKPRCVGPAEMSGRIADIDVVPGNPDVIYVGTATGGVWRSNNGGISWQPLFDEQPTSSIGDVAVFQPNPNIVWVGTGEANPRNSSGVGRGIFKSIDGGKTWEKCGLEQTEKISRIVLHPQDADIAYAAALGTTWGENPQRGVFKTTDGGRTWEKILYVDDKTGAADLVMDPKNPNKLIAALWQHRRWPWFFKSGGAGSGIYITTNAGKNWKRITPQDGLPEGELGRIGLAFAGNKPQIVYALVEAKRSALLRSTDGGLTWKTVNKERDISDRPFYYSDIRVNPVNENIVYSLQSPLKVSEDGGKSFSSLTSFRQVHGDFQALWLHPDGEYMIAGSDGGIAISRDRGKNWLFVQNLPLAQFYHISFDMEFPYNIYGGFQDNGSWRGPSRVLTDSNIFSFYWKIVGFGDGFDTEPDPQDSDCGYCMWQGGHLYYFNHKTGINKSIIPTQSGVKHRYNWNPGFAIDPFDPAVIYYGSQFVHRSPDKGNTWEIISPDLTTNDPQKQQQAKSGGLTIDNSFAENHTTILCIAPSPVKQGVIWVGTDDGNVQLTKDNGKTWEPVSRSLTGTAGKGGKVAPVPSASWSPHVEASKFDPARAFVVFDDHRRANWTPYIFVTADYGKTWQSLAHNKIDGFIHVVEQDVVDKDLLFLGTEFGLYVSFDGGKDWLKWTNGFPTVPVTDIAVHPRDHDLVIGTHGRSAYILDDISPLREIDEKLLQKKLHIFEIQRTYQYRTGWSSSYLCPGDGVFYGENRPQGAIITYLLNPDEEKKESGSAPTQKETEGIITGEKKSDEKKIKIEVLDHQGSVIRRLKSSAEKGINRIYWDLCRKSFYRPDEEEKKDYDDPGIFVLPGVYTVRITYAGAQASRTVTVEPDPRLKIDRAVLEKNYNMQMEIGGWIETIQQAEKKIKDARKALKIILDHAQDKQDKQEQEKNALVEKTKELDKKLKDILMKYDVDPDLQGFNDDADVLTTKIYALEEALFPSAPMTQAALVMRDDVKRQVDLFLAEYNRLFETDVADYKRYLKEIDFSLFDSASVLKDKD